MIISHFKGSPVEVLTLNRAGIVNARAVCILANPNDKTCEPDAVDANSVFIANTIESEYGNKPPIVVEFGKC